MIEGVLVLGLGNELFTDEGVGVAAARQLAEEGLAGVEITDGGTLGLSLLPLVEGRDALLVLDALVDDHHSPGEIVVIEGDELRREARLLYSAHQLGVSEILAAADLVGSTPERVAAVGMVPASVETGYGLSEVARSALPAMVQTARRILATWGVEELAHA